MTDATGIPAPSLLPARVARGDDLFYAAPYIPTLAIMIATSSPGRALAGAPGELSITRWEWAR